MFYIEETLLKYELNARLLKQRIFSPHSALSQVSYPAIQKTPPHLTASPTDAPTHWKLQAQE